MGLQRSKDDLNKSSILKDESIDKLDHLEVGDPFLSNSQSKRGRMNQPSSLLGHKQSQKHNEVETLANSTLVSLKQNPHATQGMFLGTN